MRDFTIQAYTELLLSLKQSSYSFQTFKDFLINPLDKVVILRHDVDRLPKNALKIAEIEKNLDIKATYYFRIVPSVFKPKIIKQIYEMGHEIGYHYEELSFVQGNIDQAYELFITNLQKIREIVPVETICMHGSPLSRWDSKKIWGKYNYKEVGIIGEPYLDIDWSEVLYLTDTGRSWNGKNFNVRDKVKTQYQYNFRTTNEIIKNVNNLPDKIMINTHPERWNDSIILWLWYSIFQNFKNIIKYGLNEIIYK